MFELNWKAGFAVVGCAAATAAAAGFVYGVRTGKRHSRKQKADRLAAEAAAAPPASATCSRPNRARNRAVTRAKAATDAAAAATAAAKAHEAEDGHDDWGDGTNGIWPERLVRSETVLAARTHKIILVLERCVDRNNVAAIYRTAESFGVQEVCAPKIRGWRQLLCRLSPCIGAPYPRFCTARYGKCSRWTVRSPRSRSSVRSLPKAVRSG